MLVRSVDATIIRVLLLTIRVCLEITYLVEIEKFFVKSTVDKSKRILK